MDFKKYVAGAKQEPKNSGEKQETENPEKKFKSENPEKKQKTENPEKKRESENHEKKLESETPENEPESENHEKKLESEDYEKKPELEKIEKKQKSESHEEEQPKKIVYPDYEDTWACRLKEAEVAYGLDKRQGEYTIEDYYALPEDVRAELIDGYVYLMAAPSAKHQWILAQLTIMIGQYINSKNGKCMLFPAPLDVQLDCDIWTMVQPDLVIVCDKDKVQNNKIAGSPDFVIEILSPSTGKKDRTIKLRKYREAGVKECWLIEPLKEEIEVYVFKSRELAVLPRVYTFRDIVPVGIYNGDCKVDFAKIFQNSIW